MDLGGTISVRCIQKTFQTSSEGDEPVFEVDEPVFEVDERVFELDARGSKPPLYPSAF
ncbi:hypothetical protein [Nostoc sp.]|uniref:hypothetical protein n=1 Tax=Nostoc sp. TaxID=1180 RepID=UPI002FF4AFF9